jgi:hypothetical protein
VKTLKRHHPQPSARPAGRAKRWAAAAALAVGAVVASVVTAQSAAAYTIVGSPNVEGYCRYNFGSSFNATVVSPGNAYDWRCYNGSQTWYGVDMNLACHQQVSASSNAIALDNNNPYSWRCVTG